MLVGGSGIAAVFVTTGLLAVHRAYPAWERQPSNQPSSFLALASRTSALSRAPRSVALGGVPSVLAAEPDMLAPPCPYTYGSFMTWFDGQDWAAMNLPMTPTRTWFDVDAALTTGSRSKWFVGKDMTAVAALAKRVNRFHFMRQIMLSGSDDAQSSMAMHLLILRLLLSSLNVSHSTNALDAGCGDGWLAAALALMRGSAGGRVFGFDIEGVDQARQNVASSEAVEGAISPPLPELFYGNLLADGFGLNDTLAAELRPYSFDAVNVGAALRSDNETSAAFQRLALLLRKGGALTVPICKEPPGSNGHCKADFRLYRRSEEGQIVCEVHSQYDVRFLAVEQMP